MSQSAESKLSNEDHLLIETNQLGSALAVYRLQPGYIRFLHWISWLLVIMGIVILTLMGIWFTKGLQFNVLLSSLLAGVCGLLGGGICLRIVVPQAQQEHIIVCEQGLLRTIGGKYVEIVRWTEVRAIEKEFFNRMFSIIYATYAPPWMKTLHISLLYQNFDELITLLKQQSDVAQRPMI